MPDQESGNDLGERLRRAREKRAHHSAAAATPEQAADNAMTGAAFRMGTELVAALAVGGGMGYFLDHWLGTRPWGMILFFMLGAGAGMMNVYRAVNGLGNAPGFAAQKNGQDQNGSGSGTL